MARRRLAGKTLLGGLTWAWAAVAVAPAHAADDPADWPTYNHDAKGWRCNPAERTLGPANVGRLVERWRFPAPGDAEEVGVVHATPAVVAGEVYFGTATYPAVHKLDVRGRPVWTYRNPARKPALPPARAADTRAKLRFATSEAGFMASPLVADGAVFIADVAGWMYCLDAATGAERWKVNTRAAPTRSTSSWPRRSAPTVRWSSPAAPSNKRWPEASSTPAAPAGASSSPWTLRTAGSCGNTTSARRRSRSIRR
jgi:outer membrane protein assembly factor BamB